ncbi:MAG: hypothetical protein AABW56_05150 [Nanoarchaeota archaeon]
MTLIDKINDALKVLTGRKLSKKQIELARERYKQNETIFRKEISFNLEDNATHNGFVVKLVETRFAFTPDNSYGWKIPHGGKYPVYHELKRYNSFGLLIEREIYKNFVWPSTDVTPYPILGEGWSKTLRYDPPGKFIGKKGKKISFS